MSGEKALRFIHHYLCTENLKLLLNYLHIFRKSKVRNVLSKVRLSSHNLNIEEERYRNEVRTDRICNVCDKRDIEDEYHFIIICPVYNRIRSKYIKKHFFSTAKYV